MKRFFTITLLFVLIMGIATLVYADTSKDNVSFTADKSTVNVGDTVTVTFKTVEKLQAADFDIQYSNDILEFESTSVSSNFFNSAFTENSLRVAMYDMSGTDTFTFTFKAKAEGTAKISTIIGELGKTETDLIEFEDKELTITVNSKPTTIDVSSITLDKTTASVEVGKTIKLTATVSPSNATDNTVTWKSSDTSVATVSNGTVTAVKAGTATITATSGTKSATCKVTVTEVTTPSDSDDAELTWTNFSNAKYEMKSSSLYVAENKEPYIYIDNVTLLDQHEYYYFVSNDKNATPEFDGANFILSNYMEIKDFNDIYELNGDIYIWIQETQYNSKNYEKESKIVVEAQKVDRLNQNELGQRFYIDLNKNTIYVETYEQVSDNRKINYKIGVVTDNTILKSIKNGDSNCLNKLLEYAKSETNGKTGTVNVGYTDIDATSLGLVNEQYYYVYLEIEDENGKYYPVEDISLYQALVTDDNINLIAYASNDLFKWNLGDDETSTTTDTKKDTTTATTPIPKTGETLTIAGIILATITIATISVIKYKRYRDI